MGRTFPLKDLYNHLRRANCYSFLGPRAEGPKTKFIHLPPPILEPVCNAYVTEQYVVMPGLFSDSPIPHLFWSEPVVQMCIYIST